MGSIIEIRVPDIGDFKGVPVIDILVAPGDVVELDQSLITLESDKATVDVPAPMAGTVKELKVKLGDKLSKGGLVLLLESSEEAKPAPAAAAPPPSSSPPSSPPSAAVVTPAAKPAANPYATETEALPAATPLAPSPPAQLAAADGHKAHASPSVRALARELGVAIAQVAGSGPKGRITGEDVKGHVKRILNVTPSSSPAAAGGLNLLAWPKVDFGKFGPIETQPLSRIQKLSGANLARNWVMIPHVTQFDAADITELEAHRVESNKLTEAGGAKLTMLAFLVKACVQMLQQFPQFNASLDGENLVLKRYYHIGFAADTPQGLMVPVIRDADQKSVFEIAQEAAALAKKARAGKLSGADMQGGCFSISSLGGIGGTSFTPIINAPEVAILGVSKSDMQPRWNGKEFAPRLMLPLSLSYDHRVIDGAAAARFTTQLATLLAATGKLLG